MRACLRFAAILPLALAAAPAVAQNVVDLVCEYKESPLGIDVTSPRLSWKVNTTEPDWMQSAYRIQVASSSADLSAENRLLWDSGKVLETASVHRVYEGPALESSARYYWRVQVWGREWADVAMERGRVVGDGASRCGGLARAMDHARRA